MGTLPRVNDDIEEAFSALQRTLNGRMRQLNAEIAGYPRPIARCDVQLTKLIDERARIRRQLDRLSAVTPMAGTDDCYSRVAQCLADWEVSDDEGESAAYDKLRAALLAVTRSA